MKVERDTQYSCVWCGAPSLDAELTELRCSNCSRSYPIVDDIPILTLRPRSQLSAASQLLRSADSKIRELAAILSSVAASDPMHACTRARGERALVGMRTNLALIEAHMKSSELIVRESAAKLDFLDCISNCDSAWSPEVMLPFFYQDWGPTDEFEKVKSLIIMALRQHRSNSEAIAVLGAGACGLVQAAAAEFDRAYGVDLSIPTLLIARNVLAGHPIVVHLENAEWTAVQLRSREQTRSNVRLATADVANLPFSDNSLSAVVTQYLMDIVGNPLRVAIEIQRVLKPGGVWVNFSLPLRWPVLPRELGRFTLEELPAFLERAGFQLSESRQERFSCVNLEKVAETAPTCRMSVHFFVAAKAPDTGKSMSGSYNGGIAAGDDDGWWRNVPEFVTGRRAEIASMMHICSERGSPRFEGSSPYVLQEDDARMLKSLSELIDGKRTYSEIYSAIVGQGFGVSLPDFRELFHYLSDRLGFIADRSQRQ